MNNPFIGQVTLFAGNFPPRAFAFCQGQLLPIASNTALFSILGTTYGGDGRTTFALPDLRGRCAIHPGRGPGLSTYVLGERQGIERVNLNLLQLPSHNHIANTSGLSMSVSIPASSANGTTSDPSGNILAKQLDFNDENVSAFAASSAQNVNLAPSPTTLGGTVSLNNTGGSQSHENRRPFIAINYIIALQGTYPSRS
jgi:microcystin-dependent protein